jgi:hypothetical protein
MKTEVIMKRDFFGSLIQQRSHSELFCANDIMLIGNGFRSKHGLPAKVMAAYFDLQETRELIEQIKWEFNLEPESIKTVTRGRNGGTWIHPLLFVDLAMWINPEFKVKVLKWVLDGLMESRDNSGDSFKAMNAAIKENYPNQATAEIYIKIAGVISRACGVYEIGADRWQLATKEQIERRDRIHVRIATYADVVDNVVDCVNKAVAKELNVKI